MSRSILFVDTRATASKAAQDIVKAVWEWDEKTVPQWIADLAEFDVLDVAETTRRAELRSAALAWDGTVAGIKQLTQDIVRLAKVRFRKQPSKLEHFTVLKTNSRGRNGIYDEGRAAEKAWLETDPTWVPWVDMSTAVLGSSLANALALGDVHATKTALWRTAASALRNKARALDDDCVGWYAAATTKFPAGTTPGDMIRAMVPTTTTVQPAVGQAVLANLMVAGREVHFDVSAAHATSCTYYQLAPGATEWVAVLANVPQMSLTLHDQPVGEHRFKAVGHNSRGSGAESAEAVVTVAEAAVA